MPKAFVYLILAFPLLSLVAHIVSGQCTTSTHCELHEWVNWKCTECCKRNAVPDSARQPRKICCPRGGITLEQCLTECNITKDKVERKGMCVDHCNCTNGFHFATTTTMSTTYTASPTAASTTATSTAISTTAASTVSTTSIIARSMASTTSTTATYTASNAASASTITSTSTAHSTTATSTATTQPSTSSVPLTTQLTTRTFTQPTTTPLPTTAATTDIGQQTSSDINPPGNSTTCVQLNSAPQPDTNVFGLGNICGTGFSVSLFLVGLLVGIVLTTILSCICKKKNNKRRIGGKKGRVGRHDTPSIKHRVNPSQMFAGSKKSAHIGGTGFSVTLFLVGLLVGIVLTTILSCICKKKNNKRRIGGKKGRVGRHDTPSIKHRVNPSQMFAGSKKSAHIGGNNIDF